MRNHQGLKTELSSSRPASRWDIFCRIVDNYGDIGVCWRLARQLASEHDIAVRLWLDEPAVAKRLITELDTSLNKQMVQGVEICHWQAPFDDVVPAWGMPAKYPPQGGDLGVRAADVVIEAFACELPQNYLAAMVNSKPVWINLEYLSAENWVADFHARASMHPTLPLTKYFFFPGFTPETGGLLREQNLLEKRDAFQNSAEAQVAFWKKVAAPAGNALRVSLFCYPHAPLAGLLNSMTQAMRPVLCLVPDSGVLPLISQYFGAGTLSADARLTKGNLTIQVLPFLSQDDYDCLLWACDINFVRGEDSWVRALWAAKPMVWQPYQQEQDTHLIKLHAFLDFYSEGLSQGAGQALSECHAGWCSTAFSQANWQSLLQHLPELQSHAIEQAGRLAAQTDLAAKLVIFCKNLV